MKLVPYEEVLRVDGELYRLVRSGARVRLEVGEALEALNESGGHLELGFASVEAYARERCDRSGRWAAGLRTVARRLAELPRIRGALVAGEISWSMAELLARRATREDEATWLAEARRSTVRKMRERVRAASGVGGDATGDGGDATGDGADASGASDDELKTEMRTLTLTLSPEEAWFFEATRKVMERVSGKSTQDEMLSNLLAEGWTAMTDSGHEAHLPEDDDAEALASWRAQLEAWRAEAEAKCEGQMGADVERSEAPVDNVVPIRRAASAQELDARICELARELSERDVAEGMLFEMLRQAQAWRRLSYASQAHYVRERFGVSLSGLKAKRALAVRATKLPELRDALVTRRIGQASASLVSRVASPGTVSSWIERAERRTVKHLREEVEIAEMIIRNTGMRYVHPPSEDAVRAAHAWESRVKSGAAWRAGDALGRGGLDFWEAAKGEGSVLGAGQTSASTEETRFVGRVPLAAAERGIGRVSVRLRVSRETFEFYRRLETAYSRWREGSESFLVFLCETMWATWGPTLESDVAYAAIYERERFVCANPTCTRTDLTPHHVVFRSKGGGNEEENLAALCVWCHLEGVHGGKIAIRGAVPALEWEIGKRAVVVVRGRDRVKGGWKRVERAA